MTLIQIKLNQSIQIQNQSQWQKEKRGDANKIKCEYS